MQHHARRRINMEAHQRFRAELRRVEEQERLERRQQWARQEAERRQRDEASRRIQDANQDTHDSQAMSASMQVCQELWMTFALSEENTGHTRAVFGYLLTMSGIHGA